MGCRASSPALSPPFGIDARHWLSWAVLLALALSGPASEAPSPVESAPASHVTRDRSRAAFLDSSDTTREALPYHRRTGLGLAAWDSPVPGAAAVAGAETAITAPAILRSPRPPLSRPRGGLPAGFLTDRALAPPLDA